MLVQTRNCSRQLERSQSLAVVHTSRSYKVSGTRVTTRHLGAHLGDWPSESAKLAVRWYVREESLS